MLPVHPVSQWPPASLPAWPRAAWRRQTLHTYIAPVSRRGVRHEAQQNGRPILSASLFCTPRNPPGMHPVYRSPVKCRTSRFESLPSSDSIPRSTGYLERRLATMLLEPVAGFQLAV